MTNDERNPHDERQNAIECRRSHRRRRGNLAQSGAEVVGRRACCGWLRCGSCRRAWRRSSRCRCSGFRSGGRSFGHRGCRSRGGFGCFGRRTSGNRFCDWKYDRRFFDHRDGGAGWRDRLRRRGLHFRERLAEGRAKRLAFDGRLESHPGAIRTIAALGDDLNRRANRLPALRAAPHSPHVEVDAQSRTFHPICPIPTETAFCTLRHRQSAS
jgi:hypothetical protein